LKLIPEGIRKAVESGTRLIASVNIDAKSSEELYLKDFLLAPQADPNDGLA
jgi:hypothetical protein